MTTIARPFFRVVFQIPDPSPWTGIVRSGMLTFIVGSILVVHHSSSPEWSGLFGHFVAAGSLVLCEWAADRFWHSSFSGAKKAAFRAMLFLARIYLWAIAGGSGYVAGALAAKKIGLLVMPDIPIRPVFETGAYTGVAMQLVVHGIMLLISRKRPATLAAG